MSRRLLVLISAVGLSIGLTLLALGVTQIVRRTKLQRQVEELRQQATLQSKEGHFAQAADTFEQLQVLFMNAGQYQEALDASLAIEEVSQKVSDRQSPWNFIRIAEAYLGMGDKDRYFEWMDKAVTMRHFSKIDYFQGVSLDRLRTDPRFVKLVAASAALVGVGEPAKNFQIPLLDGTAFELAAQRGKVVLIDFWDVRCGPCRKEMGNLQGIYKDFKDKGLEIISISLDTEHKLLEDYLKETAPSWKFACSFDGWKDRTAKLYQISATPSTWLIDRQGIVRYYDVRGDELRRAVAALVQ